MKIGIIGAGQAGSSLGKAFIRAGHEVMFSSRDPHGHHAKTITAETGASVGSVAETLAFSPVVAIAMSPNAIPGLVKEHEGAWKGKTIIDMNNQMGSSPADKFGSFAQYLASITHGHVVKAFNIVGVEHLLNPTINGQKATMLVAGDDAGAKRTVLQLAGDIGFDPMDAGGLDAAKQLENLAGVWIHLAYSAGYGRNFAFKIIKA